MEKNFFFKFLAVLVFVFLFIAISNASASIPDECASGPCCDTSVSPHIFRPSTYVCSTLPDEYGCPWGTGCGQDLGQQTATQHCSGSSADCNGEITYGDWSVKDDCYSWQTCDSVNHACSGNSSCLTAPEGPGYYYNRQDKYPSPSEDPANILLPVKLAWQDVRGEGRGETGYPVYVLTIENTRSGGNFVYKGDNPYFGQPDTSTPCENNGDCPTDWTCEAGECVPPPPTTCIDDGDCPTGQTCENGFCVTPPPPPCENNGDCPTDWTCEAGDCVPPEAGEFSWPTGSARGLTACFKAPNYPKHDGIDIGVGSRETGGVEVRASASGTVVDVKRDCLEVSWEGCEIWHCDKCKCSGPSCCKCGNWWGNHVDIEHKINSETFMTRYAHLQSVNVSVGDPVATDTVIGVSGDTGNSSGYHLHFGIYKNGTAVDPLDYLSPPCQPDPGDWCKPEDREKCAQTSSIESNRHLAKFSSPTTEDLGALSGNRGGSSGEVFRATLQANNFIAGNCLLKSGATHPWSVKACLPNPDGTASNECGPESSWSFKTNTAAELVSPPTNVNNILMPIEFDWCPAENANSYYIQILKDGEPRHANGVSKEDGTLENKIELDGVLQIFTGKTTYEWEVANCLKENFKKCGLSCGENEPADECADFSRIASFTTAEIIINPPELLSPFYDPAKPEKIPAVNLSDSLEWNRSESQGRWARSYLYEIKKGSEIVVQSTLATTEDVPFSALWHSLNFNEIYNWHVKSCYGESGTDCGDFGDPWYFKTTGAPPTNLNSDNTIIPVKLGWDDVAGAASYRYEVASDSSFAQDKIAASGVISSSTVSVGYPNLKQDKTYYWRVKTCANKKGDICGEWSDVKNFTTFKLAPPTNPSPGNGNNLYTYDQYISWNPVAGAKVYQYTIDYTGLSPEEKDEKCSGLVGTKIIGPTIISSPSVLLNLECLGEYQWSVRACLDEACLEPGTWSSAWSFELVQPIPVGKAGLVPCGRATDYPETPWNEREQCQIKHIFILLRNIIDLLLWRIGLTILGLLILATGVVYYFSMGAPTTMVRVKSILKSAGIGYGITFLAWVIINLILAILGYRVGIFGHWWQIKI